MSTAGTMQSLSEALGLSLPTGGVVPTASNFIEHLAYNAGKQIMALIDNDIRTSEILTLEAFENAIMVHAAIRGSTNALLHLPSIAYELGIDISIDLFDEINEEVPYICNVRPSGFFPTNLFWYAGGV